MVQTMLNALGFSCINDWKRGNRLIPEDGKLYPAELALLNAQYSQLDKKYMKFTEIKPFQADIEKPSPNYNARKTEVLKVIILHATAGSDVGAESWMMNPKSKVSAHFHIRRDGTIVRLVKDINRAWHAGVANYKGITDVNSCSLGIEIGNMNDGKEKYTDAQYEAVKSIVNWYKLQCNVDVASHAEIAPGRKNDPLGFDLTKI